MNVRFKPETESQLLRLAASSGCPADDLVEDALAPYLAESDTVRAMLDQRYDELKRGDSKLIEGEAFFEALRLRENKLANRNSCD